VTATREPLGVGGTNASRSAGNENRGNQGLHDEPHLLMIFVINTIMTFIMYDVRGEVENSAMKVSREQVAENRKRILDAAARLFRERGFESVTVAEVMSAAGLTHGGFYGHFDSKDALIDAAMGHVPPAQRGRVTLENPNRYADAYLSRQHRDNVGSGCPFAALGTEAARASNGVRHTLTQSLRSQIDTLAASSPGATPQERRRAAIASLSTMMGGVMLARLVDDDSLSEEILASARAALRLT
jgi:TetR/AcrR family transcriptional regulator, transcriptional repressor for nem operon